MDGIGPRIAINGFGRIGRLVTRILLEQDRAGQPVDLVGVNDLTENDTLAHLFRYDSVHGRFAGSVEVTEEGLALDGDHLPVFEQRDPADLPWRDLAPDIVIESTGRFADRGGLQKHIDAGAPRVLLTAPGKDMEATIVRGVNDHVLTPGMRMVSAASCTTNALAPPVKVLDDAFGVLNGVMTTIHSITGDQSIVDGPHSDLRRARASMLSMIPTATGAAKAIGLVLPHLDGMIDGMAVRVPTQDVSLVDVTLRLRDAPSAVDVADALMTASEGAMQGILGCEAEPLVSIDFTHDPRSGVVDLPSIIIQGDLCKLLIWYDNEWGYANRVVEVARRMAAG